MFTAHWSCSIVPSFGVQLGSSLASEVSSFKKDWSLLRATLSHYLLMLLGFIPLATLAGWFPARLGFYLSLVVEFTLVYVIIWLVSYHFYKNKFKKSIKALLTTKRKKDWAKTVQSSMFNRHNCMTQWLIGIY